MLALAGEATMSTRAEYVEGDGPPVLLITDYSFGDYPEAVSSEGLTAVEARRLAAELLVAADRADELEAGVQR